MATRFAKDQQVRLLCVVPEGPVEKFRMDEDTGDVLYLVSWTDKEGNAQQRWFKEDELTEA